MGTLVLQPQDQLSSHYSSTKMGLFAPYGAQQKKQKKPQRQVSTPSYSSQKVHAYPEREFSISPNSVPLTSSRPHASSKATRSLPVLQRHTSTGQVFSSKSYFQSNHVPAAEHQQLQRPASASGRVFFAADKSRQSSETNSGTSRIPLSQNHTVRPKSIHQVVMKKQTRSLELPSQMNGVKESKFQDQELLAHENRFESLAKSNPPAVNNKKVLQKNHGDGVRYVDPLKVSRNAPMKITILQRPKTKEDAVRNFSKLTGVPMAELFARNGLEVELLRTHPTNIATKNLVYQETEFAVIKDGKHRQDQADESEKSSQDSFTCQEFADVFPVSHQQENSDREEEPLRIQLVGRSNLGVRESVADSIGGALPDLKATPFSNNIGELSAPLSFDVDVLAEKWAGPCFTISPPPSSLPIPKFASLARQKVIVQEAQPVGEQEGVPPHRSVSASSSFSEEGIWKSNTRRSQETERNVVDAAAATNDLRRLLKLDIS